jgi:hypothetical protein
MQGPPPPPGRWIVDGPNRIVPAALLRQVLPDDLNHAVGSRTRWEET